MPRNDGESIRHYKVSRRNRRRMIKTFTSSVLFKGLNRNHFIASFTASTQEDAQAKASLFVRRTMSFPAQMQARREYVVVGGQV